MAPRHLISPYPIVIAVVALGMVACSSASPAPAPTKAPAAPTTAPAPSKVPAAAEPTKAPAVQPTAPAKKVEFPQKGRAITVIMPWAASGSVDPPCRIQAAALEKELGVPVQIVNKEGAGSQVGLTEAAAAKPDGYTMTVITSGNLPYVYMDPTRNATYTRKSFQAVAGFSTAPGALGVKANSPYKDLKDLFDAAKANPKKVKLGTSTVGGATHLNLLEMQKVQGVTFAFVFFDGDAPNQMALMGGHIDASSGLVPGFLANVQNGAIRVLGVMTKDESVFLPGVKTFRAQGFTIEYGNNRSWAVPAGTPKEIVDILSKAFQKVLSDPDVVAKTRAMGDETKYTPPGEIEAYWADLEARVPQQHNLLKEWQASQ